MTITTKIACAFLVGYTTATAWDIHPLAGLVVWAFLTYKMGMLFKSMNKGR